MAGNRAYAYSWLINHGYSKAGAAGIVGNLMQESGVRPDANQAGGPGRGIAQWSEGARWDTLVSWAQKKGMKPGDLDTQLAFLDHELQSMPELRNTLRNTKNVRKATMDFVNIFERPDPKYANYDGRVSYAQDVLGHKVVDTPGGGGADVAKKTEADYGFVKAFLADHPEIEKLVNQAVKQGWTPERLAGEVKETRWWRRTDEAQRQWDIVSAESPAQAKDLIQTAKDQVEMAASQAGVRLEKGEARTIAERAARNQWDAQEILSVVAKKYDLSTKKSGQPEFGDAAQTTDWINAQAWEYGVKLDRTTRERWTKQVISGATDVQGLEDRIREQSKVLYPPAAQYLDAGQTLRDVLNPYLQEAASQLGIPPDQMQTAQGKWTVPLTGGVNGMMTMDEWTKAIRTDRRYGWDTSSTARSEAAQITSELAKMMGGMG